MEESYLVLKNWTNYWFNHRDSNKNGLPEYNHGNDSGWDNGTEFDVNSIPRLLAKRESPNLYAYLIIQMDVLEEIANELGNNEEAKEWKERSAKLLSQMISNHWNGVRFVTKTVSDFAVAENTNKRFAVRDSINKENRSLMAFLPIILGNKLFEHIRSKLISDLKNKGYITKWGLATENPNSKLYEEDGYWRGPIWAPSTMIIVEGLENFGEHELAKEIARKYCDLCRKSGFAENFDAKTGEGLRDKAYTWTASVFLVLAEDYLIENK